MPEIKGPKKEKKPVERVRDPSEVVSAYSEEGKLRQEKASRNDRLFRILAVTMVLLMIGGAVLFIVMNSIYHFF